jgi:hypothetical protein
MVTKYKIAVNTAQPQTNTQNQVIQQIAQNAANQQLQQQVQAQAEAVDPLRQSVNDLLKSKIMNSIDIPQYTTINDVLNANKGDRLSTFADFLSNPQTMRTIGNFLPSYGYNPKTGKVNNVMEQAAQEQEALMQAKQAQAMQQLKEQNDIATSLNSIFNQRDIADQNDKRARELTEQEQKWRTEEAEKDRAFRRAENAANRAQQVALSRLIHGGGGSVTGGASGLTPKQIQKNQEMLNSLNAVQSQMDRFANSFDKVRGSKAGALLADAYAKGGFGNSAESNFNAQRTLLFNKIARELGGEKGVLSDQDIKRIEGSLPSLSDSLPQKRAKMKAVYDLLEDRKSQYDIGTSSGKKDSLGLGI